MESEELQEGNNLCRMIDTLARIENWRTDRIPCEYLVIDLETLGFNSSYDRTVQVGFCTVRDCKITHEMWDTDHHSIILKWPEHTFEGKEKAVAVHGIDYERSQREGIEPKEAMEIVCSILTWAREQGMMIVGHNLYKFDVPFLAAEMGQAGVSFKFRESEVLDTGLIVKGMQLGMFPGDDERIYDYWERVSNFRARGVYFALDRYCVSRFKLKERYKIDTSGAHDAGYDCYLTHLVLTELNAILNVLKPVTT